METPARENIHVCDKCQTQLTIRPAEVRELDINKLSLVVMFRIEALNHLECPSCHQESWELGKAS